MEEQLELIEKLKDIGVETSPEEKLESIEEIEEFLRTLSKVDETLEYQKEMLLEGKSGSAVEDYLSCNVRVDSAADAFVAVIIPLMAVIVVATSPIVRVVAIATVVTFSVLFNKDLLLSKISGIFRRRLVRSTEQYGQIVEAQAKLKKLSIRMKLKRIKLLIKS